MLSELDEARSRVRVLILSGLGLNCESETAQAFRMCGAQPDIVHLADTSDGLVKLADYSILAMVGGFSFGDHLGGGVVYANRLRYRLWEQIQGFISDGGLVIGICNGFQTMVKLGLLPGLDGDYRTQRATLTSNDRLGYRDAWVRVQTVTDSVCVWTRGIGSVELPCRHGEGKFLAADGGVAERLATAGLVALRYVDGENRPTQQWPDNPNGSPDAIAGICDPTGRLFGLMPHPEAYLYGFSHPAWQRHRVQGRLPETGEGLQFFQRGVDYVVNRQ